MIWKITIRITDMQQEWIAMLRMTNTTTINMEQQCMALEIMADTIMAQ